MTRHATAMPVGTKVRDDYEGITTRSPAIGK
jgi:hypothetical protein